MDDQPTITVEANGTASAAPDVARVRLSTFAEDPAPGDALTSCSLLTARVLGALREAGVSDSDLQTTSIDLNQHRIRETERRDLPGDERPHRDRSGPPPRQGASSRPRSTPPARACRSTASGSTSTTPPRCAQPRDETPLLRPSVPPESSPMRPAWCSVASSSSSRARAGARRGGSPPAGSCPPAGHRRSSPVSCP